MKISVGKKMKKGKKHNARRGGMKKTGSRSGGTSGRVHRLGEIVGEGRTKGIVSPSELEQAIERGSAREREQRKLIASELAETTGSTLSTDFFGNPPGFN